MSVRQALRQARMKHRGERVERRVRGCGLVLTDWKEEAMHRLVVTSLTLLAAVVLLVPAAYSAHPDDRAGLRGPGAVIDASSTPAPTATRPDDRAGVRGPGASPAATTILVSSDAFDWSDAGIGVAGGLGLALLAGGLLATATYRHRAQRIA